MILNDFTIWNFEITYSSLKVIKSKSRKGNFMKQSDPIITSITVPISVLLTYKYLFTYLFVYLFTYSFKYLFTFLHIVYQSDFKQRENRNNNMGKHVSKTAACSQKCALCRQSTCVQVGKGRKIPCHATCTNKGKSIVKN